MNRTTCNTARLALGLALVLGGAGSATAGRFVQGLEDSAGESSEPWNIGPSGSHCDIMMMQHLDITPQAGHYLLMRTTLTIDDDLFAVAKSMAQAKSLSIGKAISELARQGLHASVRAKGTATTGFPVFSVPRGAHTITLEDVRKAEDEP